MTAAAWAWAICLSGLAYWLGHMAGWRRASTLAALSLHELGVRRLNFKTKTITFADGTTNKEKP